MFNRKVTLTQKMRIIQRQENGPIDQRHSDKGEEEKKRLNLKTMLTEQTIKFNSLLKGMQRYQ